MNIAGQGGSVSGFELRPRRAGELMDVAFRLTKHTIRTMWPVMAAVLVPVSALSALQIASFASSSSDDFSRFESTSNSQSGLSFVATIVVALLLTVLVPAMYSLHMGWPITPGVALRRGLQRTPIAIVYAILTVLAFIALMIPGTIVFGLAIFALIAVARIGGTVGVIVVAVVSYVALFVGILGLVGRFQVGFIALLVEDIGPFGAMKRGFRLTKRRWLQMGALQVLMFILTLIAAAIAGGIGAAISSAVEGDIGTGIVAFAGYLLYLGIWIPMYTALGVAVYVDSRVQVEAIDLGQLSSQLSGPTLLS